MKYLEVSLIKNEKDLCIEKYKIWLRKIKYLNRKIICSWVDPCNMDKSKICRMKKDKEKNIWHMVIYHSKHVSCSESRSVLAFSWRCGEAWRSSRKGPKRAWESSEVTGVFTSLLAVGMSWVDNTETYLTVHSKYVQLIICQLHHNKAVFKKLNVVPCSFLWLLSLNDFLNCVCVYLYVYIYVCICSSKLRGPFSVCIT